MTDNRRRERLRFRSWHRGTREMDLLLGSFAEQNLPHFTEAQLNAYEALLLESDPDLYALITGAAPVDDEMKNDVTRALQKHQFVKRNVR